MTWGIAYISYIEIKWRKFGEFDIYLLACALKKDKNEGSKRRKKAE